MRGFLVILCCLWAQSGLAQGFAIHDLTSIAEQARRAFGAGSSARAEPRRLALTCPACDGAPTVDLQLGRLNDGTEERVRSGKTSLGALESICLKRNPDCRLSGISAGPAIGWISVYPVERGGGATAVFLRDGDLLSIEAHAANRETAADAVQRLAQAIMPRVVGR